MTFWKVNLSKATTLALLVAFCFGFIQLAMANSEEIMYEVSNKKEWTDGAKTYISA